MVEILRESDGVLEQDGFLIFHGTTMRNAMAIEAKEPIVPLKQQAKNFLQGYGLSVEEMSGSNDFAEMWDFIFERERESIISMADSFELARSYALRIPEWQWYLFQFIALSQSGSETSDWVDLAESFVATQPNPAVLVVRSPHQIAVPDPTFAAFRRGAEVKPPIPNPLPGGYEIVQIVEIQRNS